MPRCDCRTSQTAAPQTLEPVAEVEPMRIWPHPIPTSPCPRAADAPSPAMTQALEQLQCQNQLLVDLLGAVNSLTAALLCQRREG